jgi:hypothetical protein
VRDYIDETRAQLRTIAQEHDIPLQEKLAFLQETRHCFGRTGMAVHLHVFNTALKAPEVSALEATI